jgi:RNA polymerase sigma-70 factor (ECF subfamily)
VARGADAEDLAQEAFVKAFRSLRSYRAESPFEAWLTRIAVNTAHDFQKSAWRRRVVSFDDVPEGVAENSYTLDSDLIRREVQRRVRSEVASLPERQRNPIWLHYFEGFSVAEIGRLEKVPESTVRSRVLAGMKRLQGALSGLNPAGLLDGEAVSGGCEA